MDPDRWRQIESLYHAALVCREPERNSFLRQACAGDALLEQEVQSLLTERESCRFLEEPVVTLAAPSKRDHFAISILKSATVSHYELLEKLGEGGMAWSLRRATNVSSGWSL